MKAISILSKYCWCNSDKEDIKSEESIQMNTSSINNETCDDTEWSSLPMASTKVIKRKTLPRIDYKLKKLLDQIKWGKLSAFNFAQTKSNGEFSNISGRRSSYIGVSKNNLHWQALINVANMKRYIGTFATQKEAAIAYDFYSIAVRGAKAKTNFNYSVEIFTNMINSYMSSSKSERGKNWLRIFWSLIIHRPSDFIRFNL